MFDLNISYCFNIYMYKQKGRATSSSNISYGPSQDIIICYYTIPVSDIVLEKKIRNQNVRLGNLGSAARLGSGFYTRTL